MNLAETPASHRALARRDGAGVRAEARVGHEGERRLQLHGHQWPEGTTGTPIRRQTQDPLGLFGDVKDDPEIPGKHMVVLLPDLGLTMGEVWGTMAVAVHGLVARMPVVQASSSRLLTQDPPPPPPPRALGRDCFFHFSFFWL